MILELSLACQSNDRTRALLDGRVAIEGCAVTHVAGQAEEIFQRAFRHCEFDISELSFSTHLADDGARRGPLYRHPRLRLAVLPPFLDLYPQRPRHRFAGGAQGPPDRRAGLSADRRRLGPRHAGRGIWRPSAARSAGAAAGWSRRDASPACPSTLPPEISIEPIPESKTLAGMLAEGELDAVISPRAPSCFGAGNSVRASLPGIPQGGGALLRQDRSLPDHASDRHPPRAGAEASLAAR